MQQYPGPLPDPGEEKLIGAVASARQAGYVLAGAVAGWALWGLVPFFPASVRAGLFALPVAFALALGWASVEGLGLDRWLYLAARSGLRPREYPYRRDPVPPAPVQKGEAGEKEEAGEEDEEYESW